MKGCAYYASPVGELLIESQDEKILSVNFLKKQKEQEHKTSATDQCIRELEEYFYEGRKFFNVELNLSGSAFQLKVWNELLNIPCGRTASYLDIATRIGDPGSFRAVGLANGQNPVAIIVPCHRVIGNNGDLTGYGGGLDKKEWLLQHEGALSQLKLF